MKSNSIFPVSHLSNQMAMTGLLVGMGLLGNVQLAADIAIVQGAALALFFGFSGNARSVILKPGESTGIRSMLITRLVLMIPLSVGVFYLGSVFGGAAWGVTAVLILRKCVEWISELHLSIAERERKYRIARVHFLLQSILLAIVGGCILLNESWFLPALVVWALSPLLLSLPFVGRTLKNRNAVESMSWKLLLPHLGSTAVTGIGVYVFRISVLLMVGKADAGNLFTAFAIGGVLGSLFTFGFGPSLVLQEQRTGIPRMPRSLRHILLLVGGVGIAITAVFQLVPFPDGFFASKNITFWQALGYSLVGSVVMVFAHRQRLRDLQHGTKDDVFAPDVLVNIIIVIFIPTVFYTFGIHGMTWLYLFNAVVALVFYWMTDCEWASILVGGKSRNVLRTMIAVLLTLPVFVNLESGLFRSPEFLFDSEGAFRKLPIPLSVGACYLGIALLGNYRRANRALAVVFVTFVLMVLSTVATTYDAEQAERGKLFLLLQYVLPVFALVLGMMYENHGRKDRVFEKSFLLVVAIIVDGFFASKNITFWQALGYSLVGSVVMVFAHRQRLRDLQHGTKDDVFAPDVLVNIIIVIFIPTVFYTFGIHGMTWLYLFNAVVALVFYWMTDCEWASILVGGKSRNVLRTMIAVLLTLPVFVNLESGLFRSPEFLFDSEGAFRKLPIPLSVGACYLGIALLGNYRRANRALAVVFVTFVLMVLSTVATTYDAEQAERGKLLLLLQYVLPLFALVLGMMYENHGRKDRIFEKSFLVVVASLVPLQLLATWIKGIVCLSPDLYFFTIYQHLQYVPVIVVTGYILGLFALWDQVRWRALILAITPLMGIYVAASMSMIAIGFGVLGCLAFVMCRFIRSKFSEFRWMQGLPLLLFLIGFVAYNYGVSVAGPMRGGGMYSQKISAFSSELVSESGLKNLDERLVIWKYCVEGLSNDPALLLFGRGRPMEREAVPSAHNYYLDLIYNFGLLAIIPILLLIGYTIWVMCQNWRAVIFSRSTAGFAFVVLILLLCENNVKVSMRMPYSGIVICFLWGGLLSRLDVMRARGIKVSNTKKNGGIGMTDETAEIADSG